MMANTAVKLTKAPIGFVQPMLAWQLGIDTDSTGTGSYYVSWDDLPAVNFAFAQVVAPDNATNRAASTAVFIDKTNKRVYVFLRNAPASTNVTVWLFVGA